MNKEIDQQQKFAEQFSKLVEDASQKFKDKWDKEITFINPSHEKIIPSFNPGAIHLLSVEQKKKFQILREKYFAKSL
ncbi:MAG: hypothetical protein ACRDE8_17845 [Ginsengibacter sp.]